MRHETILILDDSRDITDGLAAGLQRDARDIVTCNDVESAQIVLEQIRVSDVIVDIQFSGPFGYEGLDLIAYARRHSPGSRIVVMTGCASSDLRAEALRRGATGFLEKPFEIDELEMLLLPRLVRDELEPESSSFTRIPLLDEILYGGEISPVFQPIIDLQNGGSVFSFEALMRYSGGTIFARPDLLFDYAGRKKRLLDLELACLQRTMEHGAALSRASRLFVNVHPNVISAGDAFVRDFLEVAERNAFALDHLVVEITEQSSISDPAAAIAAIDALRARGVLFALDDVGVAYSHLSLIDRIAPSYLKISQDFGTNFEKDPTKTKIVRNIVSLAREFGCAVILEGIEDAPTAEAALAMGIRFGQGYHFARPAAAEEFGELADAPECPVDGNAFTNRKATIGTATAAIR